MARSRTRSEGVRRSQSRVRVAPRTQRIEAQRRQPRIRIERRAPSRVVVPRRPEVRRTEAARQRIRRLQPTRRAPANLAIVNQGLRRNPGRSKPPHIAHHEEHRAGKSGWMHRHRPFVFRHEGKRWRRYYYAYPIAGLWYWYWYDVVVDDVPADIYPDEVLPACEPDSDDCSEAGLVAPAILEGRATQADLDRCAAEYRSFDRETGTYVTYGGEVRVCPYLE
jgi:hypothetical protein